MSRVTLVRPRTKPSALSGTPSRTAAPKIKTPGSTPPSYSHGPTIHTTHPSIEGVCVLGGDKRPQSSPESSVPESSILNVDGILAQAGTLSSADKKRLLDSLALEVQTERTRSTKHRDIEMWTQAVHTSLCKMSSESYGVMLVKKVVSPAAYWDPVQAFMEASKFMEYQVTERQGVYNLLADLVVEHAKEISKATGAAVTPKFVASCGTGVAGIFEAAFPGYIGSGLAHVIVKQMTRS